MTRTLDDLDSRLLSLIQTEVPLAERPFAAIADQLDVTEEEVLARLAALKSPPRPIIRQISAIFDSKALGYQSTLVAAQVDEARLDEAAAIISQHPGVSHNYRRNHAYNLWYTLAVPPDSRLGLERTVELLHRLSGARITRLMPTLTLFKIGVKLDLSGEADLSARSDTPRFTQQQRDQAPSAPLSDADKRMIRVLQQDLPIIARPYDDWARQAQVSVAQLLQAAESYQEQHRMRRFSAVLRHREVGFSANGMGVWAVPSEKQKSFGEIASGFSAVSHCYLRPTYEDWPYSMFTMVHAPSQEACDGVLSAISKATGIPNYTALYSTKEYKKTRVQYFIGDIEAWEASQLGSSSVA
jgi:DNA-binding Lrp family transcriptional regulator